MTPTIFTHHTHPFFAIDLSHNFDIEADELRAFIMAMPGWKFVELEGTAHDGTDVDTVYLWFSHEGKAQHTLYDIQALADFMDKAGFDIPLDDIFVDYNYPRFTCDCCNYAPVLSICDMRHIEGIYGNVDNPQLYVSKVMHTAMTIA